MAGGGDRVRHIDPTGGLDNPRISRDQLEVRSRGVGAIELTTIGRLPTRVNGVDARTAVARVGDTVELGSQLLLLVVARPIAWTRPCMAPASFPFGEADEDGLVGESFDAWELRRTIRVVGPLPGHVLVRGASGTGKELVARAVHAHSPRASRPLIARNAATFPEGLIDAELFGNARNYPNSGMPERAGLVGDVDGSTLFLDEIAELPLTLQSHLLRVLDSGEYQRLGESRVRTSRFRLIGATNRPAASLKHDLLARFVLRLELADLNGRREDIPLLARHLLRRIAESEPSSMQRFMPPRAGGTRAPEPQIALPLARALVARDYETNAREVAAILMRAIATSRGDVLEPSREDEGRARADAPAAGADGLTVSHIQATIDAHNGVLEDAWRALGLPSRHVLARLIRKHGIEVRRRPRRP